MPVLQNVQLTHTSTLYSFFWNYDSLLCTILLLGVSVTTIHNKLKSQWKGALKTTGLFTLFSIFVMLILVYALGYVGFEPKIPYFWPAWVLENLLIVSISQEIIYRGFILKRLTGYFPSRLGVAFSLILSSFLFAHIHTGPFMYLVLCFVAGLFYGGAYLHSKKVESAILVHFLFNLTHILFFSYPALK